jgi:hypothetical protein
MRALIRHTGLVLGAALSVFACSSSEPGGAARDASFEDASTDGAPSGDASPEDASPEDASPEDASPDGASSDGSDGASSPPCELQDGGCGAGCCPQPGRRYDPAGDCVGAEQTIGCAPKPASTSCGLLGVIGCAVTSAGTFYTSGLAPGWTGGTTCDEAVAAKVGAAKTCATGDAGTD